MNCFYSSRCMHTVKLKLKLKFSKDLHPWWMFDVNKIINFIDINFPESNFQMSKISRSELAK